MNRTLLSLATLLGLNLVMSSTHSESINFTGKLKATLPTVSITHSSKPVSDVKEVTLAVNQNGGVCSITSNAVTAMNHGTRPVCKIEWDDPQGLTAYLNNLSGVVSGAGEKAFTYTLKMYDLDTFETFHSDSYSVVFAAPVEPDSPVMNSNWQIKAPNNDENHDLYNRAESHISLNAQVTKRDYIQVIKFGDISCEIPEGSTTCTMSVDETFLENDVVGSKSIPFTVTDPYDFITQEPENYVYNWDFRPPTIVGTHVNASADRMPEVIFDYGENIVLAHNQAAVIIQSPHSIDDPMFYPTDPSLSVALDTGELYVSNQVDMGGLTINFDLGTLFGEQAMDIEPINDPVRIGDYLLYVYDFSYIRDGLYDFTFSTKDANDNGEQKTIEDIYVDRYPPDIQFVINGKQHTSSSLPHVYSLSDITILSWGGWDDGSEIVSATLDGEPIAFESGTANVKRLEEIDLPLNSQHYLAVTAKDATGNETIKMLDFNYANYAFTTDVIDVMQSVQPADIILTQSAGPYCVAASSHDLAQLYSLEATDNRSRGCAIEWVTLPQGIDPSAITALSRNKTVIASGTVADTGEHQYHFKVHSYDRYGAGKVVYEQKGSFVAEELKAPELVVGIKQIEDNFNDYHYTKYDDRPLAISVTAETAQGANLVLELYNTEGVLIDSHTHYDTRTTTRHVFRRAEKTPPLVAQEYKVKAYYEDDPNAFAEDNYQFYTVPSNMVRLSLEHPDYVMDGGIIPITAKIGQRAGENIDYLPEHGTWMVGLYTFDAQTNQYEAFIEPVKTDDTGIASLIVSSEQLLASKNKVLAKATLITPYPEIDVKRQLNGLYDVPVLSLGEISASLDADVFSAPAPARFAAKLNYADILDQNSAGDIIWQTSPDGREWQEVARKERLVNYLFTFDEPGELFVRAIVVNRLNGSMNYTNTAVFKALPLPLIEVTGSRTVARGAIGKYEYALNEYAMLHSNGVIEYSIDNKQSWQFMDTTQFLSIDNPINYTVRVLIDNGEDAPYYIYDDMKVGVIEPRSLSATLRADKYKAEAGDSVSVTARFPLNTYYQPEHFRYQMILPDGTILDNTQETTHVLLDDDFSAGNARFMFRSWVDNLKLETVSTRQLDIKEIVYDGLPPTDIFNQTPDRVNYSNINLRLVKPNKIYLPSSVVISEDIILPDNGEFEMITKTDMMVRLLAKKEGTHPIKVRFFDNRGNERWHTEFVTIHSPPEVRFDMTTRYFTENLRPPFRLSHSLAYRFGSPTDRLDRVEWYINDELIPDANRTIVNHTLNEAGEYTIKAKIISTYGQEAERTETLILHENKQPVCEPYWEFRDRVSTLFANCQDFDGRLMRVGFRYMLDETNEANIYRYFTPSISFIDGLYDDTVPIEMTAYDDSGEQTIMTVNWP